MLTPLQEGFCRVYESFRLNYYKSLFEQSEVSELSTMEVLSLSVIRVLNQPTISQFANFMNISQSNATYKINSLIKKGYIERENSENDRREYRLILSDKSLEYSEADKKIHLQVFDKLCESFSAEEMVNFQKIFDALEEQMKLT